MTGASFLFWTDILLIAYTYIGYPVIIGAWAMCRARLPHQRVGEPKVSVVIATYNEAKRIERRLENILHLSYPRSQIEVLVGSDGSTDDTVSRARAFEHRGVSVIAFDVRRGKPAVLNDLVSRARGEIVVFADARQIFEDCALSELVKAFADPNVGAVSGELTLAAAEDRDSGVNAGIGFYWHYEKIIRHSEGRVDSTVGATGAIYAIRRALFEPIPTDTILDDVLIPMRVVQKGYRVFHEPRARAYDVIANDAKEEFTRKVRTIGGNFQLFAREWWLLSPIQNRLWFQTISHKCLRLVSPILLIMAFILNLLTLDKTYHGWLLALQGIVYGAGLLGAVAPKTRKRLLIVNVAYTFCLLNYATIIAFVRVISGRLHVTWEKAL